MKDGCMKFCGGLSTYASQTGMMTHGNDTDTDSCTCIYPNGILPSREVLPNYAILSPPGFTLINSMGMALGLCPNINCLSEDELNVETQVSEPTSPRQQFQLTHDGRIVNVRSPERVLTTVLDSDDYCSAGVTLQLSTRTFPLYRASTPSPAFVSAVSRDVLWHERICI